MTRARVKPALIRRGRRADPYFWGLPPRVCEPTSAQITAYTSTAAAAYGSTVAIVAYHSASGIAGYASAPTIAAYQSTGTITAYTSAETIVTYTSTGTISRCSGP